MRELRVLLRFSGADVRHVGTLAEDGHRVWFEFDPAFTGGRMEISPLRLPRSRSGLIEHRSTPGAPIPGVFNDARPEGWGLKLLHRAFQARGRPVSSVSPLEELAFLGPHTMGALVFEPCTGPSGELDDAVELAALAAHAQSVWDDRVQVVLPQLVRAGGPSGGARPKALVGLRGDGGPGFRYGEGELPDGWDAWLVKFPTSTDDADVGRREEAWMAMARGAGIDVPEFQVLSLDGVGDAFAVRRFDRLGGGHRLHMLSAAGAMDADFRTPAADYEHLLRATLRICDGDQSQVLAMFRLAAFNVATLNEDDHLKNFAWLVGPDGVWRVAPGFDLTYAPRPYGERWTTVAGAGSAVGREHLLTLAARVGIKPLAARRVLDEVTAATTEVRDHLGDAGCLGPVSEAAADAVERATSRVCR
ncbi:MAG: type II toxin-antitoxin system HipA family toxin [Deltaproteobacteria bacterium]|nr:type II toxin-antitoxin system HipA family toxin [Deltaproteobacteria bacterium]